MRYFLIVGNPNGIRLYARSAIPALTDIRYAVGTKRGVNSGQRYSIKFRLNVQGWMNIDLESSCLSTVGYV